MIPTEIATFACGCFWTKQYRFSRKPGVLTTRTGYASGHTQHPTYALVCAKNTGHAEAVEVSFDPTIVTFNHEFIRMTGRRIFLFIFLNVSRVGKISAPVHGSDTHYD